MLYRSMWVLVVSSLFLLAGCGVQGGDTVVKYERGGPAERLTDVAADGVYELYSSTDTTPKLSVPLNKGDQIGFVTENGVLYAVAGSKKEQVDTSWYSRALYWKQKD
jgi:hypothetical protein